MRKKELLFIFLFVVILFTNRFTHVSHAQNGEEHQLRISITIKSNLLFPIQTIPIRVSFNLENIGNTTFNGKVTLEIRTEKSTYNPITFPITNLTKNEVYKNSSSFATDDAGRYWATLKIEADDFTRIALYSDSELVDNAFEVQTKKSIYLYELYLVIIGLGVVGTFVSVLVALIYRRRE